MNRRIYLASGVATAAAVLPGCSYTGTRPVSDDHMLRLMFPSASRIESGWRLSLDVDSDSNWDAKQFHDVTLYVYSKEQTLVAKKHLGNVRKQMPIDVFTSEFPHLIMADSRESVCEETVDIDVLEYLGRDEDGQHEWKTRFRDCGEELPHLNATKAGETS